MAAFGSRVYQRKLAAATSPAEIALYHAERTARAGDVVEVPLAEGERLILRAVVKVRAWNRSVDLQPDPDEVALHAFAPGACRLQLTLRQPAPEELWPLTVDLPAGAALIVLPTPGGRLVHRPGTGKDAASTIISPAFEEALP